MPNIILITTSSFGKGDAAPLDILHQTGLEIVLNPYCRKLTEDEILQLMLEHKPVGILAGVEPLTGNVLDKAKELKAIARCGIGLDSVDLEAARQLGMSVTNTPDAPTLAVAELTLGMILSLLRMLHVSDAGIRDGRWERPMGALLHGKTVGIVGCGRVGSRLAGYLKALGCTVLGCDQACQCHDTIQIIDMDRLLEESDILTLHVPYCQDTHHLLDARRIEKMKPGAYFINASRGGLVDENALYKALVSGQISGAALDCFEQEPYGGPLKELQNVLLTAHIGSYAKEARIMMETQAAENLIKQLKEAGALS